MISTIYKGKGDKTVCTNYRGVTVITVLSKLYAMVLNARLVEWSEAESGCRAAGQAGFRPGRRTTDHVFVLQQLSDKYRQALRPLFACFIDFSKAFDSINRELLWARLDSLGVRGRMLDALK